jgi:hypothetical protein
MIPLPAGVRVWLATSHTDMRKGFPSLALQVQEILHRDPLSGHLLCFRGRRGNLLKVIWHDGQGPTTTCVVLRWPTVCLTSANGAVSSARTFLRTEVGRSASVAPAAGVWPRKGATVTQRRARVTSTVAPVTSARTAVCSLGSPTSRAGAGPSGALASLALESRPRRATIVRVSSGFRGF